MGKKAAPKEGEAEKTLLVTDPAGPAGAGKKEKAEEPTVVEKVAEVVEEVKEKIVEVAEEVKEKVEDMAEKVKEKVEEMAPKAKEVAEEAKEKVEDMAEKVKEKVEESPVAKRVDPVVEKISAPTATICCWAPSA